MMKRSLLPVMVVVISACASAPVQEMSDARQALVLAKSAGAEQHSPSAYMMAQRHLSAAETALAHRNFSRAKRNALQAKQQAMCAREISVAAAGQ